MRTNRKRDFFEDLFDRGTYNQRRMIFLLNSANGRWVSRQWLSEDLGLSKRTTLSTINELTEKIEKLETENFTLHHSKGKGLRLEVGIDADIFQLITAIVSQCATAKMLEALLTEEFENVRSYALRNFISESTVRRDLTKVQKLLQQYQIEIGREKTKLIGEERQIRMFMVVFYWSVYRGSKWPFKYVDEQLIDQFVDEVLANGSTEYPRIPFAYKKQLAYLFAEAIMRTRKGNLVEMSGKLEHQITSNTLYAGFKERLCDSKGMINTKQAEIPFFFLVWLSMSKTVDVFKDAVIDELLRQQAQQDTQIYRATELMMKRFQEQYFPIEREELRLFRAYVLSSHFFAHYFKGFNTDMTGNTYKNIFSARYPKLIEKTRSFINELYEESHNSIFLEVDFLLIPYLKNILFFEQPAKYETPINVLVESDMPNLLTKNLIKQIYGYFSYLYNLTITDIYEAPLTEIDILFTTGSIKDMSNIYPDVPVVVIGKSVTIGDMDRINRALEEVADKKVQALTNTS